MRVFHSSISTGVLSVALSLLFLVGCASRPEIRLDKNPDFDVHGYRTFGFFNPVTTDESRYTTLVSGRLKKATRDELERRNYVYKEDNPDLKVNFTLNVADRQELRSSPVAVGRFGYRAWVDEIETVNYRQGALRIDLVDTAQNELVWRGVAEGRIDKRSIENPGPAIDRVVSELFVGLPLNRTDGDLVSLMSNR